MSTMKRVARLAAAAILATGVFAGAAAPADAASHDPGTAKMMLLDTGWGN